MDLTDLKIACKPEHKTLKYKTNCPERLQQTSESKTDQSVETFPGFNQLLHRS